MDKRAQGARRPAASRWQTLWQDILRGVWTESSPFRLMIAFCPALAVTTAVVNGLAMGAAVIFVLVGTNVMVSLMRRQIPREVRIPVYTIFIATFVTIADLVLAATVPNVHQVLGLFVPLIVVNCIILGRAEAWAAHVPVDRAFADGLGYGIGYTISLVMIGIVRELLGNGTILGLRLMPDGFVTWQVMLQPPGAFLTMGMIVGLFNLGSRLARERQLRMAARPRSPSAPLGAAPGASAS
ncbi:MAG: electron transport complex subunit RsxE [Limnochordales bacterium]|nr:electron transport complex subunit RsxE [Limnochordales bacterium]